MAPCFRINDAVRGLLEIKFTVRYGWYKVGEVMRVGVFESDPKLPLLGRHWKFPQGMYN
jgi:hypothetical protein